MTERGHYAVLEGPDYTGKTTQLKLAEQFAQEHGIETLFVREPGGTPYGEHIRSLILGTEEHVDPMTELLLFTADRNYLWHNAIQPALEKGITVISDRSWLSTLAYQAFGAGQIMPDKVREITEMVMPERYIHPDALAVLSLSRAVWLERKYGRLGFESADAIERRDDEYFIRVHDGYDHIIETVPYATRVNADAQENVVFSSLRPLLFPQYDKAAWDS